MLVVSTIMAAVAMKKADKRDPGGGPVLQQIHSLFSINIFHFRLSRGRQQQVVAAVVAVTVTTAVAAVTVRGQHVWQRQQLQQWQ